MPVRAARDDDHDFISVLDAALHAEGGEYPYAKPTFARLFKQWRRKADCGPDMKSGDEPDWDTRFIIIETANGIRAGFAVTSNWFSTDELSERAGLTPGDVRLWFVGVHEKFRGKCLAREAIQHIIDELTRNHDPAANGGHGIKLAAKLTKNAVRSNDLLENYFDFDPHYFRGDAYIMTCPIGRYSRDSERDQFWPFAS